MSWIKARNRNRLYFLQSLLQIIKSRLKISLNTSWLTWTFWRRLKMWKRTILVCMLTKDFLLNTIKKLRWVPKRASNNHSSILVQWKPSKILSKHQDGRWLRGSKKLKENLLIWKGRRLYNQRLRCEYVLKWACLAKLITMTTVTTITTCWAQQVNFRKLEKLINFGWLKRWAKAKSDRTLMKRLRNFN